MTNTPLSRREVQIGSLIVQGLSSQQIADSLDISPRTVDSHVLSMSSKIDARNRAHLAAKLIKGGLVDASKV
jgi:DNA-binding CsgD family transcriptional regulator